MSSIRVPRFLCHFRHQTLVPLIIIIAISQAPAASQKQGSSFFGLVFGISLVALGSGYAFYHYNESEKKYDTYEKSAFSDNTTRLRKNVVRHDQHSLLGGALASIGALGIIISF